jgi:hypothetical protein
MRSSLNRGGLTSTKNCWAEVEFRAFASVGTDGGLKPVNQIAVALAVMLQAFAVGVAVADNLKRNFPEWQISWFENYTWIHSGSAENDID